MQFGDWLWGELLNVQGQVVVEDIAEKRADMGADAASGLALIAFSQDNGFPIRQCQSSRAVSGFWYSAPDTHALRRCPP